MGKVYDASRLDQLPEDVMDTFPAIGGTRATRAFRDMTPGDSWVVLLWESASVCPAAIDTPWEGVVRMSVKHNSGRTFTEFMDRSNALPVTWDDLQAIKDRLFPTRIAIEVYPPKEAIVDVADLRWLWVLPASATLPFNLQTGKDVLRGS